MTQYVELDLTLRRWGHEFFITNDPIRGSNWMAYVDGDENSCTTGNSFQDILDGLHDLYA